MPLNSLAVEESTGELLTQKDMEFLTSKDLIAQRMRFLLAALQGYRLPWMLAEVLLQSDDSQRQLWQRLEAFFVISKKSSEPKAKEMNVLLNQLSSQGWTEFRIQQARTEGVEFAQTTEPSVLVEYGQQWQFSKNPYREQNILDDSFKDVYSAVKEAWREGFHDYLCLIREESW